MATAFAPTSSPTITKDAADIRRAIIALDELYARATHQRVIGAAFGDVPDPVRAIQSKAKIKALEDVIKLIARDPASAGLQALVSAQRWRVARQRAEQERRNGSYNDRNRAEAAIIEANAYMMAYSWALGVFDERRRPRP